MAMGKPVKTIVLRGLAVVSFAIAIIVMCLSNQTVHVQESFKFDVKFSDWNGFVFCLVVDCIGLLYNILVLTIPSGSLLWKTVIVLDVIVNMLVGTSLGVGWQTYSLIKQGNVHVGWAPLCGVAPYFGYKILGSLVTSSSGFVVSFGLLMCTLNVCVDPLLLGNRS